MNTDNHLLKYCNKLPIELQEIIVKNLPIEVKCQIGTFDVDQVFGVFNRKSNNSTIVHVFERKNNTSSSRL